MDNTGSDVFTTALQIKRLDLTLKPLNPSHELEKQPASQNCGKLKQAYSYSIEYQVILRHWLGLPPTVTGTKYKCWKCFVKIAIEKPYILVGSKWKCTQIKGTPFSSFLEFGTILKRLLSCNTNINVVPPDRNAHI